MKVCFHFIHLRFFFKKRLLITFYLVQGLEEFSLVWVLWAGIFNQKSDYTADFLGSKHWDNCLGNFSLSFKDIPKVLSEFSHVDIPHICVTNFTWIRLFDRQTFLLNCNCSQLLFTRFSFSLSLFSSFCFPTKTISIYTWNRFRSSIPMYFHVVNSLKYLRRYQSRLFR